MLGEAREADHHSVARSTLDENQVVKDAHGPEHGAGDPGAAGLAQRRGGGVLHEVEGVRAFEQEEAPRGGIVEALDVVPPVVADRLRPLQDFGDVAEFQIQPFHVRPVVAQALQDGHLPGGALQARPLALVRGSGLPGQVRDQAVVHVAARDLPAVHEAARAGGKHVDAAHHRDVRAQDLPHVADELRGPARVVAQLGHDEMGAGAQLLLQLDVLHDGGSLGGLEGGSHRAQQEVSWLQAQALGRGPRLQAAVHLLQVVQGRNRVDVENRLGLAEESGHRVVAGDHQQVGDARPLHGVGPGLDHVAVHVLAGKMHHQVAADGGDLRHQHVRPEGGVAAGVVGDGKAVDVARIPGFLGELEDVVDPHPGVAAARHKLTSDDELAWRSESLANAKHGVS